MMFSLTLTKSLCFYYFFVQEDAGSITSRFLLVLHYRHGVQKRHRQEKYAGVGKG